MELPKHENPDVAGTLSQLDPDGKRNLVGNAIYAEIEAVFGEALAGKMTGMLIEENVVDFVQLLTNQQYFNMKVREAYQLLV